MTPSLRLLLPPEQWPQWALQEKPLLDKTVEFGICLASHWMWSNMHFWMEYPSVIASVLHPDERIATFAFQHMTKLAKAVNMAERSESANPLMKKLLADLGWNCQQTAREAMALVLQKRHTELKQLARRLNMGSPSTKDVLENTFAHLHKMSALNSTNQKFGDYTKYLYTLLSPYCETGGCPQILPSKEDMQSMAAPQGFALRQHASRKLFSPQMSLFPNPKAVPKPGRGSKSISNSRCFHGIFQLFLRVQSPKHNQK